MLELPLAHWWKSTPLAEVGAVAQNEEASGEVDEAKRQKLQQLVQDSSKE